MTHRFAFYNQSGVASNAAFFRLSSDGTGIYYPDFFTVSINKTNLTAKSFTASVSLPQINIKKVFVKKWVSGFFRCENCDYTF